MISMQKSMEGIKTATKMHAYTHNTGWPRKNATTLIVNIKNIVDETELLFIHLIEHSFSNKMTP